MIWTPAILANRYLGFLSDTHSFLRTVTNALHDMPSLAHHLLLEMLGLGVCAITIIEHYLVTRDSGPGCLYSTQASTLTPIQISGSCTPPSSTGGLLIQLYCSRMCLEMFTLLFQSQNYSHRTSHLFRQHMGYPPPPPIVGVLLQFWSWTMTWSQW